MTPESSTLYRQLVEHHPAGQLLVDSRTGEVLHANQAAAEFYGCSQTRLVGIRLADLIAEAPPQGEPPIHKRLAATPLPLTVAQRVDGRGWCHIEIEGTSIEMDDDTLLHVSLRDITDHVRTARTLREYEEIFEDVPVPFYRATPGPKGRFLRVNPAFVQLLEADSAEQLLGHEIADLYIEPPERIRFSNTLMDEGEVFQYELRMRTVKGREILAVDTAFRHLDELGNPVFDGALEDITRRRELEAELSYQARCDKLTDLANRRHCEGILHAETDRSDRYGQPLSALMIDVDHFKKINDERGHAEGDRVLRWIADILRSRVRETDLAGRWGGEEFLVLLPSTPAPKAQRLADELRRAVVEQAEGETDPVTISIGYAGYLRAEGSERFMQRLDRALYAAKGKGRNRVVAAESPGQ